MHQYLTSPPQTPLGETINSAERSPIPHIPGCKGSIHLRRRGRGGNLKGREEMGKDGRGKGKGIKEGSVVESKKSLK